MTIKELKNHFKVTKFNGKYHLYVEGGTRTPYKYVATVIKKGRSMYVEGYNPTTKIEKLKEQVEDFRSNLKYDSEYYNPMYSKGYKEYMIVYDYLGSLGFICNSQNNTIHCTLNRKSIYRYNTTNIELFITGLDYIYKDELPETVEVGIYTGNYSWISTKCARNEDKIINAIDSLLKPLLVSESAQNINTSKDMKTTDIDFILNKLKNFDIKKSDAKEYIKRQLKEIHDSL